ncbi:hypothetical protein K4L04_08190 [Phaeobacter inhibens]|uniref:hypothetical protein n=1 Tax=Phaeobacter inhibens TaxID=221822 RepID=UPI0021A48437|nr:hypothetical protein [Phaeobacter inhibens]UWR77912.1 hypothetical protein K4L04_08190 [Phaeobacter inhibens]
MTEYLLIISCSVLIVLGYHLFARRLTDEMQPLRIRTLEMIEEIRSNPTIPDRVKKDLDTLAGQLLNKRAAWFIVLLFPVGFFLSLGPDRDPDRVKIAHHPRKAKIQQVVWDGAHCIVANSPICYFIFQIEIAILKLVRPITSRSGRRATMFALNKGHFCDDNHATP